MENEEAINGKEWQDVTLPNFLEYSNNRPNYPFISVLQIVEGKRRVTARIFRQYDNENKRAVYKVFDGQGNPIFTDLSDLVAIKKACITERKTLAMNVWKSHDSQYVAEPAKKIDRENDLQKIRSRNTDKEQDFEIER